MDTQSQESVAPFSGTGPNWTGGRDHRTALARVVVIAARALFALGMFCVIGGLLALVWLFFRFMNDERGALWLLVSVTACHGCAPIPLYFAQPFGAQPLEPEAWFSNLGNDMADCIEAHGGLIERDDFENVRWFVTLPKAMGPTDDGGGEIAGWWSWPNRIFLDSRYQMNAMVLRHELGHFMLQAGNSAHPLIEVCQEYSPSPEVF